MKWFEGDIAGAVTSSRAKKCIFLVYIEGNDEQSKKMTQTIEQKTVSDQLSSSQFIALKVKNDSVSAAQFSQIYPVIVVPSIYFIGVDGKPLNIVAGNTETPALLQKIEETISKHSAMIRAPSPSQSSAHGASTSSASAHTRDGPSARESSPSSSEASSVIAGDTGSTQAQPTVTTEKPPIEEPVASTSDIKLEDKVEHAKKLLAEKRAEKAKADQEKEKQEEQQRRKVGQEIQRAKEQRAEEEMKQAAKDRQRERQLEKEARERVRQQIAQDRADRAAKWEATKAEEEAKTREANLEKARKERAEAEARAAERSSRARIQVRLPDGSAHVFNFSPDDSLKLVRTHVQNELTLPCRDFSFSQLLPRHQFSSEEEEQSLRQLQLAPSAVLLILPIQHSRARVIPSSTAATTSSSESSGTTSSLFWTLMEPLFAIFNYIKIFLFGPSIAAPPSPPPSQGSSDEGPVPSTSSGNVRRRPETGVRREGNMMRLTTNDSDEDDNTYNGNSTQQM